MASFIPFNRDQAFLLPPDLKSWLPDDDLAHFVVAAVERVPLSALRGAGSDRRQAAVSPTPECWRC